MTVDKKLDQEKLRAQADAAARKRYRQHKRSRRPKRTIDRYKPIIRAVAAVLAFVALLAISRCSGAAEGHREAESAIRDKLAAETRLGAMEDERNAWETSATILAGDIEKLESDVASLTEALERWESKALEASGTIAAQKIEIESLKARIKQQSNNEVKSSTVSKASYDTSGVERWRALVQKYFGANTDAALSVMRKESGGNPRIQGPVLESGVRCAGLFQQHPDYWPKRIARAEKKYGRTFSHDIFDPEANIAASAVLSSGGTDWSHWSVKP